MASEWASAAELSVRALSPAVTASLSDRDGRAINFDYLGVSREERGAGLADRAIATVCAYADEHELTVWMQPDSGFGSNLHRLSRWYSGHGFVPVAGLQPFTMRRSPDAPRMVPTTHQLPVLETSS